MEAMEAEIAVSRILVVDDDEIFANRLSRALEHRGYKIREAYSSEEALNAAVELRPDAAVLDLRIGRDNGLELAKRLIQAYPGIRVVMLTGYGSIANALEGIRFGVVDYLTKPTGITQVLGALLGNKPNVADEARESPPSLDRVEWEHIQRVLHDCDGNITRAAEALGIHRRSLQQKLGRFPSPN